MSTFDIRVQWPEIITSLIIVAYVVKKMGLISASIFYPPVSCNEQKIFIQGERCKYDSN